MKYRLFSLGDRGTTLQLTEATLSEDTVQLLKQMHDIILKQPFPGLLDIIIGYDSISLLFDRYALHVEGESEIDHFITMKLQTTFEKVMAMKTKTDSSARIKIPVCYDKRFGLDLDRIATHNGLPAEQVVDLHQSGIYHVYMIGFLPGFPYMGFVDDRIATPRLASPRQVVAAGSIGIAGRQTGIYPLASPGGWNIIGRTPVKMFDPSQTCPVRLTAGDVVSFYPISLDEFNSFSAS